jgi:hypothetical protein
MDQHCDDANYAKPVVTRAVHTSNRDPDAPEKQPGLVERSRDGHDRSAVKWQMAIPACVFDALGLLALNSLLASASSVQAGSAFVIVTVVQVAIPATYLAVLAGGLTRLRSAWLPQ